MKKLSIKTRLLGGFICVIVLSAIMTVISIVSMANTKENYESAINGPVSDTTTLIRARLHLNIMGKYVRDMIIQHDYAQYEPKFRETQASLEEELVYLKERYGSTFDDINTYYDKVTTWISEADVVLCVGAEAATSPLPIMGLASAHALSTRNDSPATASRPFDASRDGFVMGEGGGCIIIETEAHAKARGAHIHASIIGWANSTDGYHVTSPHPEGIGAVFCMQRCLEKAGIQPTEVDYINAHGTSTPKGDIIETIAIKRLFGSHASKLAVTSTKGSTGHMMGAGGITETIACVKAIQDGIIPPTLNLETQDPECDLDYVPNAARTQNVEVAMSNAFGFGGQNSSILLKKYK